jgi:hypothetical protein
MSIQFSFEKASPAYYLLNYETYGCHIEIDEMEVKIPCSVMHDAVYERLLSQKKNIFVKYNLTTRFVQTLPISQNVTSFNSSEIFPNKNAPVRVAIGFLKASAHQGSKEENPFNFMFKFGTTSYVKSCKLMLNETEIGSFNEENTQHDCMMDFYRLYDSLGMTDSPFSSSISYDLFKSGAYLKMYDLSTGGKCNMPYVIPQVRNGMFRLKVQFSDKLPFEIMAVLICEYASTMQFTPDNKVSLSYLT